MRAVLAATSAAALLLAARPAAAIERLFIAAGGPSPEMSPAQEILFVTRHDVVIGEACGGGDPDAGVPDPDAGVPDAGCEPVIGDAISMFLQPRFSTGADGARFALLLVTPGPAAVRAEDADTFTQLAELTAPEVIVERVEVVDPSLEPVCASGCGGEPAEPAGCSGGSNPQWDPPDDDPDLPDDDPIAPEVIGSYEVARITTTELAEIAAWLDAYGYAYQDDDLEALAPYVTAGWSVTALRVAVDGADDGALEPLSFTYAGSEPQLPLGLLGDGTYPLTVYTHADERRDWSIGRVEFAWPVESFGDGFLTRTAIAARASAGPDGDPTTTAVPGNPTVREEITVIDEIPVPPQRTCDEPVEDDDSGEGCCRLAGRRRFGREANFVLIGLATLVALGRRRRRR